MTNTAVPGNNGLLQIESVSVRFGGVQALDDVSFEVRPGEILGLIGPNGAGKTTLFNCISRLCQIDTGSIRFGGEELSRSRPEAIMEKDICRTFQNIGLYPAMTTLDNVLLGAHHRLSPGLLSSVLTPRASARREQAMAAEAREILDWFGLADAADVPVGSLPFGTQKRIELARALLSRPRLLMLDEPANGLTNAEVDALSKVILEIRQRFGVSILLVEHHMRMVMSICDRVVVLEFGRKIADDLPAVVRRNERVVAAYLGAAA
jgi:branched-chain amino acid transport system ATP-binding protein